MRRCIGLDVHREFAQVAIWEDGIVREAGPIRTTPEELRAFAENLGPNHEVALEATCNTYAIATLLERYVARVVISNPKKTRAIAEAKVKTDKIDAEILAQLLAADYPRYGSQTRTLTPFGARLRVGPISCASALGSRTRFRPSCSATSCPDVPRPTCSDTRAELGFGIRIFPTMSATRWGLSCASSTSTARSCGSSTPSSDESDCSEQRSAG
jgi:hypothetical protein